MIIQSKETKTQTSLIDLLGGNTKSSTAKSNDVFSKLLASFGAQTKGNETKIVQSNDFKAIISPKASSTKSTDTKNSALKDLQTLLVGKDEKDSTLVSKDLLNNLSPNQVRTLINSAKEYLKNTITAKSPEYQADPKSLPKTLGALVQLAQKMGLEPQSITLSTIVTKPEDKKNFPAELLSKPLLDTKALAKLSTSAPETTTFETITQLLNVAKTNDQKSANTTATENPNPLNKKSESEPLKALLQNLETTVAPIEPKDINVQAPTAINKHDKELIADGLATSSIAATLPKVQKLDTKTAEEDKSRESKIQNEGKPSIATLATQKIDILDATPISILPENKNGDTKVSSTIATTSKSDPLIALLKGEDTAKESKHENNALKAEGDLSKVIQAPKADSLEVKAKEATQSMRYFATDLKDAVDSYKPPLTRLTMKLNPEKLGEVEVTLVQRGNNIHVSIQSNNTSSIAFLAHNATELKAQLAHQGITGATMNFMSTGDGQTGQQTPQQQQQQQQEQQQNRFKAYESLKGLELNDEQLSALEIIIPHYA